MKFTNLIFSLSIIFLIVAVSTAQSATIHVPADQPTIQAGIDAAISGDTVLVAPGVYEGEGNRDIDLSCRMILLRSTGGPQVTVIDCDGAPNDHHRAFRIECSPSSSDTNATIEGFTITNGYAGAGAGLYCYGSRIVVRDCWFIGNTATNYGGGAGVVVPSTAMFDGCLFTQNNAQRGGGLFCSDGAVITATNCTFYDNSSPSGAAATAIFGGSLDLSSSVLAFNSEGVAVFTDGPLSAELSCCDLFGNAGGDWVGSIADQLGTNGNFSLDPLFCDTSAGDLHLDAFSPCLPQYNSCSAQIGAFGLGCDAGNICADANGDSLVNFDDVDFLMNFYFYGGATPFPYIASDLNCDGSVNIADITYLAAYINGTGAAPCCQQ